MDRAIAITKYITAAVIYLLTVTGIVHTAICYCDIRCDISTSCPATVALLLLVPYGLGVAASLITGSLVLRRLRGKI